MQFWHVGRGMLVVPGPALTAINEMPGWPRKPYQNNKNSLYLYKVSVCYVQLHFKCWITIATIVLYNDNSKIFANYLIEVYYIIICYDIWHVNRSILGAVKKTFENILEWIHHLFASLARYSAFWFRLSSFLVFQTLHLDIKYMQNRLKLNLKFNI